MLSILDRYIIRKFLGTLVFMLLLLTVVVVVIDVQQKTPIIHENGYTVGYFLVHFYPYWMLYLIITFMSILVFISVMYFTSDLANKTEIVAFVSSGASFHRFARPYAIAALFLAAATLGINHYLLPWANIQKNKLIIYTHTKDYKEKNFTGNVSIATRLKEGEFIFINSYNRMSKRGSGYKFQKFNSKGQLSRQILADEISWNEQDRTFHLNNYFLREPGKSTERLESGELRKEDFGMTPEELFPDQLQGENRTTPELIRFIQNEEKKGNANLNVYKNELHMRSSMPVAIVILSFLALSLSSQKKRGGLGASLAIGIVIAFVFVFSFEILKLVSGKRVLDPLLAMWLPNLVFGPITVWLYLRRANQ